MEIRELRIGNYINGSIGNDSELVLCSVTGYDARDEFIFVYNDNNIHYAEFVDFQPIQLTEEILLKFRYKKIRDNEFLFDNHFIIFIKESKIDFCLFNSEGNDFFVCEIQFAHELQNLHYSIKKEELTFKN